MRRKLNQRARRALLVCGALATLFIGVTFLGGSAIWYVFGFGNDLEVKGTARISETTIPSEVGGGWPTVGGDAGGHRYSAADAITPENVSELEAAWVYRSGAFEGREAVRNRASFQATPILADDQLILCTQFNDVVALDPGTGTENWRYSSKVAISEDSQFQHICRGVTFWQDDTVDAGECASRIFMGTVDRRIIALDSKTGQPCLEFGDRGAVTIAPDMELLYEGEYQINSPPAVVDDAVIVGPSIGDNRRVDAPAGTVFSFDARSGELLWEYDPLENDAAVVGHANVWTLMSVDHERGWVFLPTSSASPDYFGGNRPGDNANANSIIAMEARTGRVVWSYQTVNHDVWDYDLSSQPGLYRVFKNNQLHDVVVQPTKMGLIFTLDRDTGEPFHPVSEVEVPQGGVEGEVLSRTQPIPTKPPPIVPSTVEPDSAFGVTLWDKLYCRNKLSQFDHEGLYTPPSERGTIVYPFSGGGANWGGSAYDERRNLLIVNMNNMAQYVRLHKGVTDRWAENSNVHYEAEFAPMTGAGYSVSRDAVTSPFGIPCSPPPWGVLAGIDLASGEIVWRRALGNTRDLALFGIEINFGTPSFGGPIITGGGLVFIAGTMDRYIRAFDVSNGAELWRHRLPAGGQATPMSYEWNGRQYVVISAGGHARSNTQLGDYLMAFALPEERRE